jgi:hypothetical protein
LGRAKELKQYRHSEENAMEFYVMTRGVYDDYAFIGNRPAEEWWNKFSTWTVFEEFTIIVSQTPKGHFRLYVSGIPSQRKDKHNTQIRYALALEKELPFNEKEIESFLGLLILLEEDFPEFPKTRICSSKIGEKLDALFTETYVNNGFLNQFDSNDVEGKIEQFFLGLSSDTSNEELRNFGQVDSGWQIACYEDRKEIRRWVSFAFCVGKLTGNSALAAFMNLSDHLEDREKIKSKFKELSSGFILNIGSKKSTQGVTPLLERLSSLRREIASHIPESIGKDPKKFAILFFFIGILLGFFGAKSTPSTTVSGSFVIPVDLDLLKKNPSEFHFRIDPNFLETPGFDLKENTVFDGHSWNPETGSFGIKVFSFKKNDYSQKNTALLQLSWSVSDEDDAGLISLTPKIIPLAQEEEAPVVHEEETPDPQIPN